jgi:hypothetical protein
MKTVNLQLSIEEANLILEALGNLPFSRVYALVAKIQEQASQQLRNDGQLNEQDPSSAQGKD